MDSARIKENLLKLHVCPEDFTLELAARKDRRAYGRYFPDDRKIVLYGRNFENTEAGQNSLFYTAMHELAHHIQFTEHSQKGTRAHTRLFYSILDDLAEKAEGLGLYRYDADRDIKKLVDEAVSINADIAALQRRLGSVLNKLHGACLRKGVRYEDVLKRKVKLSVRTDKKLKKIAELDLPAQDLPGETGFEIQETLAGAKNEEQRTAMLQAVADGKSVAQVKQAGSIPEAEGDELETLVREKERIKKTIENLKKRLADIVKRISKMEGGG